MGTQYITGDDYPQYQAEIAAGPANLPLLNNSWTNAVAAHNNNNKARYAALESPLNNAANPNSTHNFPLPSVGINAATGTESYFDWTPQRYTL